MPKQLNEKIGKLPIRYVWLFDDQADLPTKIHILPMGEWDHPMYGKIIIDEADIQEFVEHFNAGIRKDLRITAGHEVMEELPAIGWFKELINEAPKGLYATVEWTEQGKDLLRSKAYKYFSPEFYEVYEDPETHEKFTNVLVGGALTNQPYFKELDPVVFSEPRITSQFKEPTKMDLKELAKKNPSELSAEEKAFVKEHQADLSDEEKTAMADVIKDEKPADPPANPPQDPPKDPPADPAKASEKVMISAAELKVLQDKANKGFEAAQKLEAAEIDATVSKLTFSETNKEHGKFLPKSKDKVTSFVKSLSESQRKEFSAIMADVPQLGIFKEIGDAGAADTSAAKKVDTAVQKVMSETKMSYSDALKKVFTENPQLEKEYEAENPAA